MTKTRYKNIFFFSGQGAQYHGMAESLYLSEPVFRKWMDEFDKVCVGKIRSVTRFLYTDSKALPPCGDPAPFDDIRITHPAMFMVQYALAKTLIHYGIVPDYLIGTSLGEYVAMALACVMPAQSMLEGLIDHARAIEASCAPGAMIGVSDRPRRYDRDPVIFGNSSLAGISSPRHFVLSGDKGDMDKVASHLERTETRFQQLPVRFGFHSPNIEPALEAWNKNLKSIPSWAGKLNSPEIKVISCCTGGLLASPDIDHFADIGRNPILLPHALKTLDRELLGSLSIEPEIVNILDLGPGSWSSGFVRQNKILGPGLRIYRVMTLFGNELKNMNKLKAELIL